MLTCVQTRIYIKKSLVYSIEKYNAIVPISNAHQYKQRAVLTNSHQVYNSKGLRCVYVYMRPCDFNVKHSRKPKNKVKCAGIRRMTSTRSIAEARLRNNRVVGPACALCSSSRIMYVLHVNATWLR